MERARASNPKLFLTESSASAIAKICARLDGIPLAIELAAARTKLLTPEQIAARLDDRFRLLVGGSRTALPRQQTLRALIDWSYDLLSQEEQRLLRTVSVFVGGWTLDEVEAVSKDQDIWIHLEQLVNKSLVITEERDAEMRYFLLETIRQYAREKLFDSGQAPQVRDRHFAYFDDFSEKMWDVSRSPDLILWRERIEEEWENFLAALDWSLGQQVEAALHLAGNICVLSSSIGHQTEGLDLVKSTLERARSLPAVQGEANLHRQKLIGKALFAEGLVGLSRGARYAAEVLQEAAAISRLTGDKQILGYSLEMYFVAAELANLPGGPEAVEEGMAILSDMGDRWGMFMANLNMARVATFRGNFDERRMYLEKNQELLRETPLSFQAGMYFLGMGMNERFSGHHQAARPYFEEGLKVFRKLRNKNFENVMMSELGHIARLDGDFRQAMQIYRQTLLRWQDLGHRPAIAHQLECIAFVAIAEGHPERAASLIGAAEALRAKIGTSMAAYEQAEYDQQMAGLRALLNETDLSRLWAEGRAMTMEQAIQFAVETKD